MAVFGHISLSVIVVFAVACGVNAQIPAPEAGPVESFEVTSMSFFMAVFCPAFLVLLFLACANAYRDYNAGATLEVAWRGKRGLDAAEIAALPLVFYRDVKGHRIRDSAACATALECAVCLLEFDDDDALRLLPACPHVFHPECIGQWLAGHVTCPLCRASVLDPPPPPLAQPLLMGSPPDLHASATAVTIDGAGDRGREERRNDGAIDFQCLSTMRRVGRPMLRRSNSTGHDRRAGGLERFALRLPEHVRAEILMSRKLRHVTSAVASVRVREGSGHGAGTSASVRSVVAKVLSRLASGGEEKSGKGEESPRRRRECSVRLVVGEGVNDRGRRSV